MQNSCGQLFAQEKYPVNYDESKVPEYTLPDVLTLSNGEKVESVDDWMQKRRPELLRLFSDEMFGQLPDYSWNNIQVQTLVPEKKVFNGKGICRQIRLQFSKTSEKPKLDLLIYLPVKASKETPCPVFVEYNFNGNHTVSDDPDILLADVWKKDSTGKIVCEKADDSTRGSGKNRWTFENTLDKGFGVITAYYGDISPDFPDSFEQGVHSLFPKDHTIDGGAIAAWAWGYSRIFDFIETQSDINSRQVILMGHSRLGKTALWAGALDERFAIVISNDSGCSGAALSRREFGETVARINGFFPHWFCSNYKKYSENIEKSPMDQHELLALIAPRPLAVGSATEDLWADPRGELLSAVHADPVYRLFGLPGLGIWLDEQIQAHQVEQKSNQNSQTDQNFQSVKNAQDIQNTQNTYDVKDAQSIQSAQNDVSDRNYDFLPMIKPDSSIGETIHYHYRAGKHDVTPLDRKFYEDFAEKVFSEKISSDKLEDRKK